LNNLKGPRVIIASSGMMTGGRVLHHLKRCLPDENNIVVLGGYQAHGTRGRRLQNGEKTIRIHGQDIANRAETARLTGLSAHADANELLRWVNDLPAPKQTFIVHGDDDARVVFGKRLENEKGHRCILPEHGSVHELHRL
jgi:metallo-beta-lactamase family protein